MPDPKLFKRFCRLTVTRTDAPEDPTEYKIDPLAGDQGFVIEKMRIEFEIERNLKSSPNTCSIRITNLNEASRTAFKEAQLRVVLEAGYEDNYSVIFSGDVTYAMSELDGPNWITHVECGDGDRIFASARVGRSYKAGTQVRTIITDALASIGQAVPDNVKTDPAFSRIVPRGYTAFGELKQFMTGVLKPLGYSWSIQDNKIQILGPAQTSNQAYTLSSANGMIGSPEFGQPPRTTKKGKKKQPTVTVKSLLYPQLRPGAEVNLVSRDLVGQFKLLSVKHVGDSWTGRWDTEIEINPNTEKARTNKLGGNPTKPSKS